MSVVDRLRALVSSAFGRRSSRREDDGARDSARRYWKREVAEERTRRGTADKQRRR